MVEVELLKRYRGLNEGERAGFNDEEADDLVERKIAKQIRRNVPETAGLGGDGVTTKCPHCEKGLVVNANGQLRAETATDARMQPARGQAKQAEARA